MNYQTSKLFQAVKIDQMSNLVRQAVLNSFPQLYSEFRTLKKTEAFKNLTTYEWVTGLNEDTAPIDSEVEDYLTYLIIMLGNPKDHPFLNSITEKEFTRIYNLSLHEGAVFDSSENDGDEYAELDLPDITVTENTDTPTIH